MASLSHRSVTSLILLASAVDEVPLRLRERNIMEGDQALGSRGLRLILPSMTQYGRQQVTSSLSHLLFSFLNTNNNPFFWSWWQWNEINLVELHGTKKAFTIQCLLYSTSSNSEKWAVPHEQTS